MFTLMIVASMQFIDKILFSWWVDPVLAKFQQITLDLGLADTFILPLLSSMRVIQYFVPTTHLLVFVSIIIASTTLKIYCALYHGIVKLKPT